MNEQARITVLNWVDAINTKDLEKLIACYHPEAVHVSPKLKALRPETEGKVQGHLALRSWYEEAMQRLPQLRYEVLRTTMEGTFVFLEYIRHNPGDAPMQVGELFEVVDDTIRSSRVYHS